MLFQEIIGMTKRKARLMFGRWINILRWMINIKKCYFRKLSEWQKGITRLMFEMYVYDKIGWVIII